MLDDLPPLEFFCRRKDTIKDIFRQEFEKQNHKLQLTIESPANSIEPSDSIGTDCRQVLWEPRLEKLCGKWHDDCLTRSKQHIIRAKFHKRMFAIFSLPAIVLPLLLSLLTAYPLVSSSGMILTSILTGVNTFFNHSKQELQHSGHSAKFFRLAAEIETEMVKRRQDRLAADVFLERISMEYRNISVHAPL